MNVAVKNVEELRCGELIRLYVPNPESPDSYVVRVADKPGKCLSDREGCVDVPLVLCVPDTTSLYIVVSHFLLPILTTCHAKEFLTIPADELEDSELDLAFIAYPAGRVSTVRVRSAERCPTNGPDSSLIHFTVRACAEIGYPIEVIDAGTVT